VTRRPPLARQPAQQHLAAAYRGLVLALGRRAHTARRHIDTSLPDWADPSAIVSLSLRLPGRGDAGCVPTLEVALRDGIPAHALPACITLAGHQLPLRVLRAPRLLAQAAPAVRRTTEPLEVGTATALVRDRLAPDRNYLLTCGHVVAPTLAARVDEPINVQLQDGTGSRTMQGWLAEWLPALGGQAYVTSLDAALVEVARQDAIELQHHGALLPAGVGGSPCRDQAVTLRRRSTALPGALKIHWSGWVDLPGLTPGVADYFLADAVGYASAEPTIGGDSGAALWDADERLIGMHLGAIPDAAPGSANAVLAPIAPVLDWFAVQPYSRGNPATLPASPLRAGRVAPPVLPADERQDGDAVSIVARTLWGEARGEGALGMEAVAGVIRNRWDRRWGGAQDAVEVCLARKQFSCWNAGDPNLARMERVMRSPDDSYLEACSIARELLAGTLRDRTDGATHYIASTLRQRPGWLQDLRLCAVIGNHEFYKGGA